jgi:hypothetical protein
MRMGMFQCALVATTLAALGACSSSGASNASNDDASPTTPKGSQTDTPPSGSESPQPPPPAGDAGSDVDNRVRPKPPPFPTYSKGTCPTLVTGPDRFTSLNTAFPTGSQARDFRVLVPKSYDGSKAYPVVFAWHWLNASGNSFIDQGELETAADQMKFIAIVPEKLQNADGKKTYQFDWPFVETWGAPAELTFVDDMLACVSQQLKVDPAGVYGIGVSAGALWVTYLSTQPNVSHFAGIESLSGGLGSDPFGAWKMPWVAQPNKFPALVLWGGPTDSLVVNFEAASKLYRDDLRKDNHFVVECTHDAGHAMPPIPEPTDGTTRFACLWRFMLDHPYGLLPGESPYTKTGLPPVFPSWCSIAP